MDAPLDVAELPLRSESRSVGIKPGRDIVAAIVACNRVREADQEPASLANGGRKTLHQCAAYFRKHRRRMHYADLVERGLPIGSGVVEAACKTLRNV